MAETLPGRLLMGPGEIQDCVEAVAFQIVQASPKPEVIVPILNGAIVFAADLMRALSSRGLHLELAPIVVKRNDYGFPIVEDGDWRRMLKLTHGRRILIVDTIHDSGKTAKSVIMSARIHWVASDISFACLLCRNVLEMPIGIPWFFGKDMQRATDYYYGYGLDRNGAYRGLRSIFAEAPSDAVPESKLVAKDKS